MTTFLTLQTAAEAGPLVGVNHLVFDHEGGEPWLVAVVLTFKKGELHLFADGDLDTVKVLDHSAATQDRDTRVVNAKRLAPWKRAIGLNCWWTWTMTNQAGYFDATQLLFASASEPPVIVQLLVEGSQFKLYHLSQNEVT